MTSNLRVGVVTTTRADYGIYRPLLMALRAAGIEPQIMAGGTHCSETFGRTVDGIVADDLGTIHIVNHFQGGDSGVELAASFGRGVSEFAKLIERLRLDLMFVLGDRYEMLAAGAAGALTRTPMAHLHGGDVTEGVSDDQFRHALTKLCHLHFPALPVHAERIIAMGEERWRVHCVGSLALDALNAFVPEPIAGLAGALGLDPEIPTVVVVYHPETLSSESPADLFGRVSAGLDEFHGQVIVLGSNADHGHVGLRRAIGQWIAARNRGTDRRIRAAAVASMDQSTFWSWLTHASALVGNSSTGMIEAPSLRVPVVNIGDRQKGRVRGRNVIDVPCDSRAVGDAVRRATSAEFRREFDGMENPYGGGTTAQQILGVLADLPPRELLLVKRWAT